MAYGLNHYGRFVRKAPKKKIRCPESKAKGGSKLRVFRISIPITDSGEEAIQVQSRVIFEPLAKLVHLAGLNIYAPRAPRGHQELDLWLESGLSLSRLLAVKQLTILNLEMRMKICL